MLIPARVYISVPRDSHLPPEQLDVKKGVFERIWSAGFEPHEFFTSGDFSDIAWSPDNVQHILSRCQGAAVLGFVRWDVWDAENKYKFITAYNHYEGALALANHLPTFVLMHEHAHKAGIALKGRAPYYARLPDGVDSTWLQTDSFLNPFHKWVDAVGNRRHIFLGHSSKAQVIADKIKDCLNSKGASVLDWKVDFDPTDPTMDGIQQASKSCLVGIFLFTKDDEITAENINSTVTRDSLIFGTGYFMRAKGMDKILIIQEEGARIPAELSRHTRLTLQNQEDTFPIEKDLEDFITKNL